MVKLTKEQTLKKYGVRSGLEQNVMLQLQDLDVSYEYEGVKVTFTQPEKKRSYTPDFFIPHKKIFIETKGRFTREDRQKHEWIRAQYPDLDIRFVFTNPNAKISATSKTTYAMWCEDRGFHYAKGLIPKEWIS